MTLATTDNVIAAERPSGTHCCACCGGQVRALRGDLPSRHPRHSRHRPGLAGDLATKQNLRAAICRHSTGPALGLVDGSPTRSAVRSSPASSCGPEPLMVAAAP